MSVILVYYIRTNSNIITVVFVGAIAAGAIRAVVTEWHLVVIEEMLAMGMVQVGVIRAAEVVNFHEHLKIMYKSSSLLK